MLIVHYLDSFPDTLTFKIYSLLTLRNDAKAFFQHKENNITRYVTTF